MIYLSGLKPKRRAAFMSGVRTMLATIPGNFAWGFVVGLSMINLGLSLFQSLSFATLVYSGSAQMVAMPLMASKTALSLIVFACFLACIRFIIYSAAMAPNLNHLPLKKRLIVGSISIDGAIGLYLARRAQTGPGQPVFTHRISYLMGMNTLVWLAWTSGIFVGIFAAGALPPSDKFSYLGIVALLGITVVMIQNRAGWACVAVAALVSIMTQHWPYQLGLLCAILVGIATGFATLRRGETA